MHIAARIAGAVLGVSLFLLAAPLFAQQPAPSTGEIIVRLTGGLDSTIARPGQTAAAIVTRSSDPAVKRGSAAVVTLTGASPAFSVSLTRLTVGADLVPAASSAVTLTGMSRIIGLSRGTQAPQNSVSGPRVFLPQGTDIRFTLAPPPAAPSEPVASRSPARVPQTPAWRLLPPDDQHQGLRYAVAGTAIGNGHTAPAALILGCSVTPAGRAGGLATQPLQPATAYLTTALRTRANLLTVDPATYNCEGDMDSGASAVFTQIGSAPSTGHSLCIDSQANLTAPTPVDLDVSFNQPHFAELLNSAGQVLTLTLRDPKQAQFTATFTLPPADPAVTQAFSSCLDVAAASLKAEQDSIVVSCPATDGMVLSKVDVLQGPSLRPYKGPDTENDIGQIWALPTITKAHPTRPKLVLACTYSAGAETAPPDPASRKTLPIPAKAEFCVFRHDREDGRPFGRCQTGMGTGY